MDTSPAPAVATSVSVSVSTGKRGWWSRTPVSGALTITYNGSMIGTIMTAVGGTVIWKIEKKCIQKCKSKHYIINERDLVLNWSCLYTRVSNHYYYYTNAIAENKNRFRVFLKGHGHNFCQISFSYFILFTLLSKCIYNVHPKFDCQQYSY